MKNNFAGEEGIEPSRLKPKISRKPFLDFVSIW